MSDVLMSIRPMYTEAILAGTKTVELRRRRPSFSRGTRILVYATSPDQRVQGAFDVGGVIEDSPEGLWPTIEHRAGVDRETFDSYFSGCDVAFAIEVENPRRIVPAALPIRPPQSYQFLDAEEPRHRGLLELAAP
ncbi:MAG: ASCH domain-containing protein [Solirubrobacteraceae bacterium]